MRKPLLFVEMDEQRSKATALIAALEQRLQACERRLTYLKELEGEWQLKGHTHHVKNAYPQDLEDEWQLIGDTTLPSLKALLR